MGAVTEPQTTITADTGAGSTTLEVVSWDVSRDLTGGALPGQVRAASGFSVGSGRVRFRQGDGATPWRGGPVQPGQACAIDAAVDVDAVAAAVARMRIRTIGAGSALTAERTADVEDQMDGLRAPVTLPAALSPVVVPNSGGAYSLGTIDAAWAIDTAARQAGYLQTAQPVSSCIMCTHLVGSASPEVGTVASALVGSPTWGTDLDGRIYMAAGWTLRNRTTQPINVGDTFYVTVDVPRLAPFSGSPLLTFYTDASESYVAFIDIGQSSTYFDMPGVGASTAAYAIGPDRRVQVQVERLSSTSWRIRARTSYGGAWTAWLTQTSTSTFTDPITRIRVQDEARGVQVHTADDPSVWTTPTARIAAAQSPLTAVMVDSSKQAWSLAQDVAAATLGALWIDEAGVLTYRNRDDVRGLGVTSPASIVADTSVEDLPWSISRDDVADRVEVSYSPPDVQSVSNYSLTVWQSTDVVAIPAGKTVTIFAELDDAITFDLAPWIPIWDTTTAPTSRWSRWAASTQRDGGGPQPSSTALAVVSDLISPSRIRLRITNNTAGTLYTAGSDGTSQITIRANVLVRPSEAVTIATGKTSEGALNPLQVSLGAWVQDGDVAQSILAWLWATVSAPLPVLDQVRVVPDLSIRLGSIRTLRDPPNTGIVAKVLVVGTNLTGAPGSLVQTLRLAVLDVLEGDLAALFVAQSLSTEASVATYYTALGAATEGDLAALLPAAALA